MALPKPLKILGIITGVFIALIVIAVVTLIIMYPPQKIKAMVLPHIEKAVGRSVDVEGAGISFFPVFGIKIKGLRVSNTEREGFSKEPFVTLDDFIVKVKVMPLIQKRVEIKAIIINKPDILLEVDQNGSFNYDDLAFMKSDSTVKPVEEKPEEEKRPADAKLSLPIPVTLEQFAINQGSIAYIDRKAGSTFKVGQINHRIDFSIDKELRDIASTGELKLSDISVKTGDIPKTLSGFTLTFAHDVGVNYVDGEAVIKSMRLSLQKIYIALSGTVKNFNVQPEINLAVKTDKIFIADLLKEIPVEIAPVVAKLKAAGFIELAMDLSGIIDSSGIPRMTGKFTLGDGNIQYAGLPEAISDIRANISFTKNSLAISELGFNMGKNPVMIQGTVNNFAAPEVNGAVNATVNLDDLKNIVELPEGVTLSGMITSDIKANGTVDPADPSKMNIDGTVALTNVRAVTPEVTKPVVVNGTVGFTPKQIVNKMNVGIGSSDIAINANIADYLALVVKDSTKSAPRPKLNFTINSGLLNTDEFMPQEKKESAPKSQAPAVEQAPQQKSGPSPVLAAPLPAMDINGTIACKKIVYQKIALNNFLTRISSLNDVLNMVTQAQIMGGSLSNNLNLNAKNLNNVQIANKLDINNMEANDFISQFKELLGEDQSLYKDLKKMDNKVFGKLTLKTDFKGNGATTDALTRSLDGSINARIDNGRIASSVFTQSINERVDNFSDKTKIPVNKVFNLGEITFRDLKFLALIKNEQVQLESFDISSAKAGDWIINGKVGFNGGLDMAFENRLTNDVSQRILSLQDKVKGVAKGALSLAEKEASKHIGGAISQTLGKVAEGQLDKALIQPDQEGRVTMLIGMGGTASAPKPNSFGFKEQKGVASKPAEEKATPKQELTEKVQEIKQEVQQKVEQQVDKVTEEATKKVEEAVGQQVPKEAKKEVQKGVKKLKGLLK